MAELKPYTVKEGIRLLLVEKFPSIVVYNEPMMSLLFPNFFLFQLTMNIRSHNYNHWLIDYFGTIRYRAAEQPERLNNINEQLDFMSLQLSWAFIDYIEYEGVKFRITQGQPSEKIDGVLHWFWNTTIRVTREQAEAVKQMQLEYTIKLKNKE